MWIHSYRPLRDHWGVGCCECTSPRSETYSRTTTSLQLRQARAPYVCCTPQIAAEHAGMGAVLSGAVLSSWFLPPADAQPRPKTRRSSVLRQGPTPLASTYGEGARAANLEKPWVRRLLCYAACLLVCLAPLISVIALVGWGLTMEADALEDRINLDLGIEVSDECDTSTRAESGSGDAEVLTQSENKLEAAVSTNFTSARRWLEQHQTERSQGPAIVCSPRSLCDPRRHLLRAALQGAQALLPQPAQAWLRPPAAGWRVWLAGRGSSDAVGRGGAARGLGRARAARVHLARAAHHEQLRRLRRARTRHVCRHLADRLLAARLYAASPACHRQPC